MLKGKQYAHIKHSYSQERNGDPFTGERILLDDRRAATQVKLPKILVRDQCGLIFGEDHRPLVVVKRDKAAAKKPADGGPNAQPTTDPTNDWIAAFVHDTHFWKILMDALWKGAPGSSAIVLKVLGKTTPIPDPDDETGLRQLHKPDGPGRYFFEVWPGQECSPKFYQHAPDTLEQLERRYFIGEDALAAQGYNVPQLKETWKEKIRRGRKGGNSPLDIPEWVVRIVLDSNDETWYQPVPKFYYERNDWKDSEWNVDTERTISHNCGEVPAFWERPLPLDADEYYPDGACLFEDVIDAEFRINRTLSQTGRAFDYAGDPQIARMLDKATGTLPKSTFGTKTAMGGTASDVIDGDAKFVEITGDGLKVAIEAYVNAIHEFAKAAGAMSRVTPDSKGGTLPDLSSLAMKMLNYSQLILSGILRETAGEMPGDHMLRLAMRIYEKVDVELPSLEKDVTPDATARFEWQWPAYYEPHGQEKVFEVQAATEAAEAGAISKETMVENVGPLFDVVDTDTEIAKITQNKEENDANDVAQADAMAAVAAKHTPEGGVKPPAH